MAVGARITDEALAELRQKIGQERAVPYQYHQEATKDAIRHFAYGIGDTNPLWLDEEYARKTRWGGIITPPCFLFSCAQFPPIGLPGVHAMFSGTDWEFYEPVRLGDCISATVKLHDLIEKPSRFSQRMVQQVQEVVFRNQRGETVARVLAHSMRTERQSAREKGKYEAMGQHRYSPEEIKAAEAAYEREEIRGANPRYWEEVQVGEELSPIVKGPLTVTDVIAWLMGWGSPFIRAHRIGYQFRKAHPAACIPNELGIPDIPERVHWEDAFARRVGVPAAYDYGPQRISWLSHLMTNWIGDDAWLKALSVQVRRFNLIGDTTWCRGRVTDKYIKGGEHLVECEIWAENQRGEITAPGHAMAILPSKGG